MSGRGDGIVTPELAKTQDDPSVTIVSSARDQDLWPRNQEAPFSLSLKRLIVQISPQLTVTRGIYVLPAHRHRIFSDPACLLPTPRDTGLSIAIREMTQASQTTNYTFSLLMMSSLPNFSCIWSSKQNSRAQCFSPNGHKFLQKISGCSGPGAIIQRVQSVIFHLGNYRGDIFIIKLREDPRNGWCVDWGSRVTGEGGIISLSSPQPVTFPPCIRCPPHVVRDDTGGPWPQASGHNNPSSFNQLPFLRDPYFE